MPNTPLVLTTFANSNDAHLDALKEEATQIRAALSPLDGRDYIKLHQIESATLPVLFQELLDNPNRVAIFHYSGHADGKELEFEGGAGQAKGLAQVLCTDQPLSLVFLNGCATAGMVGTFIAAGAKAVIATSVPIGDLRAAAFSTAFYKALADKRTIREAFEFAKATLQTTFRDAPEVEIVRGAFDKFGAVAKAGEELPWRLYLAEKTANDILSYHLPFSREVGFSDMMRGYVNPSKNVVPNRFIVYMVLDEMCKYNPDIYAEMSEMRNGKEVPKDSSKFIDLVVKHFPWFIGSQISLLRIYTDPSRDRMEQLISTYIITSQLLYYILLSNVWEAVHNGRMKLPKGFMSGLKTTISEDDVLQYDYMGKALAFCDLLKSGEIEPFVPEFKDFAQKMRTDNFSVDAYQYLEQLRKVSPSSLDANGCDKTEQSLAIILRNAAFLATYTMMTVRNISIHNPRFEGTHYDLDMGNLNALAHTGLSLYNDAVNRTRDTYSNFKSIVLVMREENFENYLNLSPFIIDKNTYLANRDIDPFIFGYEKDGVYYYLAVKHSLHTALADFKGTDIIDTTMTEEDFAEGRNITSKNAFKTDDMGLSALFGGNDTAVASAESPKVFTLLEEQWIKFKSEVSA